ncbi:MAG: fibronectin type III domain-containing protein [Patescibacteria group bacterium]|nr:MAG: fibronectin type III domain-containing protein [Patescibacteria group bacterium]
MSSQRRAHNLTKFLPVLIGAMAVFLLSFAARAATITGYSVLVTRLAVNASADHEIKFVTPTGVQSSGDTITVTYESDYNLSSIGVGDIDLALDTSAPTNDCTGSFTDKTLASSPSTSPTWGVGISGQVVTFTPPTDAAAGEIPTDTCVRIRIGLNATTGGAGANQIVNPSGAFAHAVGIAGGFSDTGLAYTMNNDNDQVTVSAEVAGGGGGGGGGGTPNPPVIMNVRTLNLTETDVDVLWETDVSSTSVVDYGLTAAYGSNASTPGNTFNHSVHLSGLTPGTTYHYRVRSQGVGTTETVSGDFTFTTPDSTAPSISNVQAVLITGTTARITWDTNEDADALVDYGLTASYGSNASNATMTNAHTVNLSGLSPSTTYHFRATSKDASNNTASSGDFTFTTADTVPPTISNIFTDAITQTSARVNWATDELADSRVRYGLTDSYGAVVSSGSLVANHQITLNGLAAGTLYHFSVSSADAMFNGATSTDQTFTTLADSTPPSNVSSLNVTPGNAQNALSWTNPGDADFAGVRIQRSTTAHPASPTAGTNVYDGIGTSMTDTGLVNGTTYYYTAFAYDNSGNFSSGAIGSGTPFDTVPPGPVSNFTVMAGDSVNALSWTNPGDVDFSNVQIQRSVTGYPATSGQGTAIYTGSGQNYNDTGLVNGTTYYYSIFARDTSGNFSGPAQASGTPSGPPPSCGNAICDAGENYLSCPADCTAPAPVCGNAICDAGENYLSCPADCAAPPPSCGNAICDANEDYLSCSVDCAAPTPTHALNANLVRAFALSRTLELHKNASGEYRILPNRSMTVLVPIAAVTGNVTTLTLNLASGSYLLERTALSVPEEGYVADITSPSAIGPVTGTITAIFDDGATATAAIRVRVEPLGVITHAQEDQQVPLSGVSVKLQKRVGSWIDWDALPYQQANPFVTNGAGTYAFMAPPGEYRIQATRDGYRTYESASINLATEVVNASFEMIAVPPSVTEVYVPGAPVTENIANIAKALGAQGEYITRILTNEVIRDPRVETTTTQFLVPAAAAVTTAVVATAVQATSIVSYLYFLLTQPLLLIGRRKRKGYGTVYNALTKLPVDLASIRLYRTTTNRLVRTAVTDKQGRYAFIVEPGEYRLEVTKPGYVFPTKYLTGRKEDAQFLDLYHGESIVVSSEGGIITANVPLDPIEMIKTTRRLFLEELGRRVQNVLAFSSVVMTLIAALLYGHLYLYILVVAQLVLYLLFRRLARTPRPKNWGIIYDEHTKRPIPFAVARIIETQYNKTLESRIADSKGRYNFLVGSSKYFITVEKPGYEPTKTNELDLTKKGGEAGVVSRDIPMREKRPE